ncbi:MAG: metal-dependent hydrolase [Deinococcota bacterium]
MKAPTHLAFAGLVGVTASGLGSQLDAVSMSALAVGALLPDVDTSTSGIGRWFGPVSGKLERTVGHRTLTHSLLGLVLTAGLSSWLLLLTPRAWLWLLVGMLTHILLDAHNIQGVPLLYPLRLEFVSVTNKTWRCGYGSPAEFGYLAAFALSALALSPLALDGFSPWFHRVLGAPYGAVEDYLLWRDRYQVVVDVRGVNLITAEAVNDRFTVIDALSDDVLLVEDGTGRSYTVGQGNTNIHAKRVAAWRADPRTMTTYRLELAGRRVSDLMASLPRDAQQVLLNAELELDRPINLPPVVGSFARLDARGTTLHARSASIGDFVPLADTLITQGSAVVRAYYHPEVTPTPPILTAPPLTAHVLTLPNLPSVSGLLVSVGDEVVEGERIARYVDDDALATSQAEAEAAHARLPELERELIQQQASFERDAAALEQTIHQANDDLAKLRYLVSAGARPRNDLVHAEHHADDLAKQLLDLQTTWTSQRTRLDTQLRETRVSIASAERDHQHALDAQWVRAPFAGIVSDIRITQVGTQGIDLELTFLQGGDSELVSQ